jgi:hypothetical protein
MHFLSVFTVFQKAHARIISQKVSLKWSYAEFYQP